MGPLTKRGRPQHQDAEFGREAGVRIARRAIPLHAEELLLAMPNVVQITPNKTGGDERLKNYQAMALRRAGLWADAPNTSSRIHRTKSPPEHFGGVCSCASRRILPHLADIRRLPSLDQSWPALVHNSTFASFSPNLLEIGGRLVSITPTMLQQSLFEQFWCLFGACPEAGGAERLFLVVG